MACRRRAVVASALVLALGVAAALHAEVAASAVPAGGPHLPRAAAPVASVTSATAAAAAARGGGAAAAASARHTLRLDGFVPMRDAECKRTRQQLVKVKRALVKADCADEADKETRLGILRAAISILRAARTYSPTGIKSEDMGAVAAALSIADPNYVCAMASSQSDSGDVSSDYGHRSWSNVIVTTSTPVCCADWSPYDNKCCFTSCFEMSVLFPALLSLDYCCGLPQNACELTHSCPDQIVYAVAS